MRKLLFIHVSGEIISERFAVISGKSIKVRLAVHHASVKCDTAVCTAVKAEIHRAAVFVLGK